MLRRCGHVSLPTRVPQGGGEEFAAQPWFGPIPIAAVSWRMDAGPHHRRAPRRRRSVQQAAGWTGVLRPLSGERVLAADGAAAQEWLGNWRLQAPQSVVYRMRNRPAEPPVQAP
jgi:hypothetical protein